MVTVFLKGGVWKNSEDEILKAAVQKYGKQQWARVASLLNRKTAKQAKARWHEWLDPSIKKTEWSRAEEEKLLHLAKLMPAQWKTIAPMVGRTALQCQEHYERLLDQAATGDDTTRHAPLRPGQIDAHPESRPARPDPIDMDEDELEMLQEARARLANTQGKKAKRKEREKMLAQAKRLADLQKRRELKQAGLVLKTKKRKNRREIDLGHEIPFHKPAPAGFHDTTQEVARSETLLQKRKISNEAIHRTRDREAAALKKKEQTRLRVLEQTAEKYGKPQKEDEVPQRPRGILALPEPTVTDTELGELAKQQQAQEMDMEGTGVTQALLGDYSDRPLPTPMRTPATASGHKSLLREASQLRKLERGQTPLLSATMDAADEDEDMEEPEADRKMAAMPTPNPPDRLGAGRTPHRDELGLNRGGDDASSVGASTFASSKYSIRELARQERRAAKRAREELEASLAALPAPQYEYELAAPADVNMEDGPTVETVSAPDRADLEAAERERLRKEAEKLYEARSSVLKRKDLPRPTKVDGYMSMDTNNDVLRLVDEEVVKLLQHDAHAFPYTPIDPLDDKKKKRKHKEIEIVEDVTPDAPLESIPEELLNSARVLVQQETELLLAEKASLLPGLSPSSIAVALEKANRAVSVAGAEEPKSIEDLKTEYSAIREAALALKKRNDKTDSKLSVMVGGYTKRADKFIEDLSQASRDLEEYQRNHAVYRNLQTMEQRGAASRVQKLQEEIQQLKAEEAEMQREYGDLTVEKRRRRALAQK